MQRVGSIGVLCCGLVVLVICPERVFFRCSARQDGSSGVPPGGVVLPVSQCPRCANASLCYPFLDQLILDESVQQAIMFSRIVSLNMV